jgi:hypothetical protein
MEQLLKKWERLNTKDKEYLRWIMESWQPPANAMAEKLLLNPRNFA